MFILLKEEYWSEIRKQNQQYLFLPLPLVSSVTLDMSLLDEFCSFVWLDYYSRASKFVAIFSFTPFEQWGSFEWQILERCILNSQVLGCPPRVFAMHLFIRLFVCFGMECKQFLISKTVWFLLVAWFPFVSVLLMIKYCKAINYLRSNAKGHVQKSGQLHKAICQM